MFIKIKRIRDIHPKNDVLIWEIGLLKLVGSRGSGIPVVFDPYQQQPFSP